jgi:divinyl protochlorophyllide a 8-vinyl-reductase
MARDLPDGRGGRIGPNAVIQTTAALRDFEGQAKTDEVFASAGLGRYLEAPPEEMIDEREAADLFAAVYRLLPRERADAVAREAGTRTGDYILAHRIPKAAQTVLRLLPRGIAGRLLLAAIAKHAWTFAGSGAATRPKPMTLAIADNPIAMPDCVWHTAVFTRLFARIVDPRAEVHHTSCCCAGAPACVFTMTHAPPGH